MSDKIQSTNPNYSKFSIYKPNSKNMGSAVTFSFNREDGSFYVEIIKQFSWNPETKTGNFSGNRDVTGARKVVKFTESEIGAIILTIQTSGKRSLSTCHKNNYKDNQMTSIKFGTYPAHVDPTGFSLSFSEGDNKFSVPLTFAEATVLNIFLQSAIVELFGFGKFPLIVADANDFDEEEKQNPRARDNGDDDF